MARVLARLQVRSARTMLRRRTSSGVGSMNAGGRRGLGSLRDHARHVPAGQRSDDCGRPALRSRWQSASRRRPGPGAPGRRCQPARRRRWRRSRHPARSVLHGRRSPAPCRLAARRTSRRRSRPRGGCRAVRPSARCLGGSAGMSTQSVPLLIGTVVALVNPSTDLPASSSRPRRATRMRRPPTPMRRGGGAQGWCA